MYHNTATTTVRATATVAAVATVTATTTATPIAVELFTCEVAEVCETVDPARGEEGMAPPLRGQVVALHDDLHVAELPDVDDHPGHVAADEDHHDAEQHEKHRAYDLELGPKTGNR